MATKCLMMVLVYLTSPHECLPAISCETELKQPLISPSPKGLSWYLLSPCSSPFSLSLRPITSVSFSPWTSQYIPMSVSAYILAHFLPNISKDAVHPHSQNVPIQALTSCFCYYNLFFADPVNAFSPSRKLMHYFDYSILSLCFSLAHLSLLLQLQL